MSLPNLLSLLRIFLVPFFFTELVSYQTGQEKQRWLVLAIFAFAAFTDALDGFLARILKSQTELGRFLDPLADKLLLLSGYLGLLMVHDLPYTPPLWVTVAIVFRDVLIVSGLVIIYFMTGKIRIQPNFLGKLTTASQMITLMVVLLRWHLSYLLWNFTAVLTILSCLVYLQRELKKLSTL